MLCTARAWHSLEAGALSWEHLFCTPEARPRHAPLRAGWLMPRKGKEMYRE